MFSDAKRRKVIRKQKTIQLKILRYLYDWDHKHPNFLASLKMLKDDLGLNISEIKRALYRLKEDGRIYLAPNSLDGYAETNLICLISPGGNRFIELGEPSISHMPVKTNSAQKSPSNNTSVTIATPHEYQFTKGSGSWLIVYDGKSYQRAGDMLGLAYIQMLLKRPQIPVPSNHLESAAKMAFPIDSNQGTIALSEGLSITRGKRPIPGSANEVTSQSIHKMHKIQNAIDDARQVRNNELAETLHGKLLELVKELPTSRGHGKRKRYESDAEASRKNVQRRIQQALLAIEPYHQELYDHLNNSIHTGIECVYSPPKGQIIRWKF